MFYCLYYTQVKKTNFMPATTADDLYTRLLKVAEEEIIIHFISPTVEGKVHDKTLCDNLQLKFSKNIALFQDLDYLDYHLQDILEVFMPP
jgi:hypothetical protein